MSLYPHVTARRVELRPGVADDSLTFYKILLGVGVENLPPPAVLRKQFFETPNALFRIQRPGSDEAIGFGTLRELSQAGQIRLALYVDNAKGRNGVSGEALFMLVNYAFATYNIDTILCRTTEESFADLRGDGDEQQKPIGIFPGHRYFRGRLLDLHNFLVFRHEWSAYWHEIEDYIIGPRGSQVTADRT